MVARAFFDELRSLAFGGISGTYAVVGSALTVKARAILLTNSTDADLIVSDADTVVAGKLIVIAKTYVLWDIQSNINPQFDDKFVLPIGTQFYTKQVSAPSEGALYLGVLY